MAPEVREAALGDWVEMLHGFSQGVIERACKQYMRNQPRRRPTPGDIHAIALTFARDQFDRRRLPPPPEPKRDVVTPEAARRIMEEAGFTPDLSRALKRFPKAKTAQEAMERAEEPPVKEMTYETDPERLRAARAAAKRT